MSWGTESTVSVPNATLFNDRITDAEWDARSAGTPGLKWNGFLESIPAFSVWTAAYTGAAWAAFTERDVDVLGFQTNRSISAWWRGTAAGSATLLVDFTGGDDSDANDWFQRTNKVRIMVDHPLAGDTAIFTGFVIDRYKIFNASGYPQLRVVLVDHIGYTAQNTHAALTGGARTTGYAIDDLLQNYGAGVVAADVAGVNTAHGLSSQNTIGAGNVIDSINTYLRGELGVLWVDPAGVYQFSQRDWWYPQPDPVATIGSLDRGHSGRDDPAAGDTGYKFPATLTVFSGPLNYFNFTWHFNNGASTTSQGAAPGHWAGNRQLTDTVFVIGAGDAFANLTFLKLALNNASFSGANTQDTGGTLEFPADYSLDAMSYAAETDITDFLEVAKETQEHLGREWVTAWVVGVHHSWDAARGWWTTLDLERALAEHDDEAGD